MTSTAATSAKLHGHMPKFAEKWSHEQREAAAIAYADLKLGPYRRISELAAAGALTYNGRKLDPFDMPPATVASLVQRLRKRRAGEITTELAKIPPRDAIEALRVRLVSVAEQ